MTMRTMAAVLMANLLLAPATQACPFCEAEGQTLTSELKPAKMVIAVRVLSSDIDKDISTVEIDAIVKDHDFRGKQTKLSLSRYLDPMPLGEKGRLLLFCDVHKGKIDAYRGMFLKEGSKLPEYCRELLKIKDDPTTKRLNALFAYLAHPDLEVSSDAYKEFAYADYKDYKAIATTLPAETVLKWLKSADTPSVRLGLYASMLGHCGQPKHAADLRAVLDDPERRSGSGIAGALAGYAMLKPKDGWAYILTILQDSKQDFNYRYTALQAVRFLYDYRNDVVSKKEIIDGLLPLLPQKEIADLAIEQLRQWQRWEMADKVMGVQKTPAYAQPIVQRSLLRYALQCKGSDAATAFVAARKKADPEAVADAQELLDLEAAAKKPATDPSKK